MLISYAVIDCIEILSLELFKNNDIDISPFEKLFVFFISHVLFHYDMEFMYDFFSHEYYVIFLAKNM